MTKKKIKDKPKTKCAHLDCETMCDEDSYCYGCKFHICEPHSTNPSLMHGHEVVDHWESDGEDEDW